MVYVRGCFAYVLFEEFDGVMSCDSLSHFEFIFMHGVRVCSNFIDLLAAVQFSQHSLLRRLSFPRFIFLPPLLKINYCSCLGLFLGSLFFSINPYVCF